MALNLNTRYPNTNPADADFPQGSIRNDTVPGDKTGTPVEKDWLNDYVGFTAALLAKGGVTPSGNTDTASSSDRLTALAKIHGVKFDSVAQMDAATWLSVGMKVQTLGYYAEGGGGGNVYEIVAAATGADDGGSFIDLSGSGLQAKGLFVDGTVNVLQFGAKKDGVTSDDASFSNAIAYEPTGVIVPIGSYYITGTVAGKFLSYGAVTIVNGTVNSINNINFGLMFGGAVRNDGVNWSMIVDSAHEPINISSVTEPDAFTYKITYESPAGKVGTVLSVIDAELAFYGIHTGASGGLSDATFNMVAPCVLYVDGIASVSASPLWTSQTGPITQPNAASLSITHAPRSLEVDPPSLSLIAPATGSSHNLQYHLSWGATTTTITALDHIQGRVSSNGSSVTLNDCPNINTSVSSVGGVVTITHDDASGNYIPMVTSFNSQLRPEILDIGNTSFSVQFRDPAGAVVGALTSDMNFYFHRMSPVPSDMDAGVRFGIDLGLCRAKGVDVGNVSLNNFWIVGINNQ